MQLHAPQYAAAWYGALKDAPAAQRKTVSRRALNRLYRSGDLGMLPEIVRTMEELESRESGVEKVTVASAAELTEAEARQLVQRVMPKAGPAPITLRHDPELIAGSRIETKNSRWDLSLRTRLNQAYNRLTS